MTRLKFSTGYQQRPGSDYMETLLRNKEYLADVYFSWGDMPSGRGPVEGNIPPWESTLRQKEELTRLSDAGIPLVLLLNASCYGASALSRSLFAEIGKTIDSLLSFLIITGVTVVSPVIARFVRENYPHLDVRASVNIGIGTVEAMTYVEDVFTGFYLQREYNRDLKRIQKLRAWCDEHGKGLHILANGGCLAHCPARHFHDNMVAHERELAAMDNAMNFSGLCREYFSREGTEISYVRDLRFIRPEDVYLYEGYADTVKLATRVSRNPSLIIEAYASGRFSGNLLDLLEPDYSACLYPRIIDNRRFPAGFGKHLLDCDKNCAGCTYCGEIARSVLYNLEEDN